MRRSLSPLARVPFIFMLALLAFALVGCAKPEPPVLTAKEATVVGVTAAGVDLRAQIEAFNPNKVDLSARSVTATLKLDGTYDIGTVTIERAIAIPAGARVMLDVPIAIKWSDLTPLVAVAAKNTDVPYQVVGTVNVGGERLNVDLPFKIDGVMTHDQIMKATLRSLPPFPMPFQPNKR